MTLNFIANDPTTDAAISLVATAIAVRDKLHQRAKVKNACFITEVVRPHFIRGMLEICFRMRQHAGDANVIDDYTHRIDARIRQLADCVIQSADGRRIEPDALAIHHSGELIISLIGLHMNES